MASAKNRNAKVVSVLDLFSDLLRLRPEVERLSRDGASSMQKASERLLASLDERISMVGRRGMAQLRRVMRDLRVVLAIEGVEEFLGIQASEEIDTADMPGFARTEMTAVAAALRVSLDDFVAAYTSEDVQAALGAEGRRTAAVLLLAELANVSGRTIWRTLGRYGVSGS